MSVSGNLQVVSLQLGQSHQHNTGYLGNVWGHVVSDITAEDATSVTLKMNGAFWYDGYDNYVPWEIGVWEIPEGATDISGVDTNTRQHVKGHWDRTTSMYNSDGSWNWWWMTESTFTFSRKSTRYGIMPYVKIGAINRWGSMGDSGSGSYWCFGNYYGVLCMTSIADGSYHGGMSYNDIGLDAFLLNGGVSSTNSFAYSQCPKIVEAANPLFVANSSGTYKRATGIYVYDSSGAPRRAKSITVYDSSGNARTMQC